jgi:hypothetical protein
MVVHEGFWNGILGWLPDLTHEMIFSSWMALCC